MHAEALVIFAKIRVHFTNNQVIEPACTKIPITYDTIATNVRNVARGIT